MRRRKPALFKDKTFVIAAVVCFIAVGAMTVLGIYQESSQNKEEQNLVDLNELPDSLVADNDADNETEESSIASQEATTNDVEADNYSESEFGMDNVMDATDEVITEDTQIQNAESDTSVEETGDTSTEESSGEEADLTENQEAASEENITISEAQTEISEEAEEVVAASGSGISINFTENSSLAWPISGNVLLNYSMDQTVYFATLNQYKYNPALIIQATESDPVTVAANGTILSISNEDEIGLTVTMDVGNGYETVYGQLKNVTANEGATLEKGEVLGYIAAPSKYYVEEGTNLYFELLNDDSPINPMNYLE